MVARCSVGLVHATARGRSPSRGSERGAVLFIVVVVLTLLTAVGLFATHSATLVDQAAGYSRQAAQTAYLAELGTLAGTAELGSGAAGAYHEEMLSGGSLCRMNNGIDTTDIGNPPCLVFSMSDIQSPTGNPLVDTTAMAMEPDFVVEVTDIGPSGAPIAGMDIGGTGTGFSYMKVTATAIAQIRPESVSACAAGVTPVAAQQMMRAHLIVGPVSQ